MEDQENKYGQTSNRTEPQRTEHQPMDANDVNRAGHIRLIVDPPEFNIRDYAFEPMDTQNEKPYSLLHIFPINNFIIIIF
jgi:hypothetical protein